MKLSIGSVLSRLDTLANNTENGSKAARAWLWLRTIRPQDFSRILYVPSIFSGMLTLFLFAAVLVLLHLITSWLDPWCDDKIGGGASSLIVASLAAITFPVMIFVIGLSRDKTDFGLKRSEVLLRYSLLFPLAMTAVLMLFYVFFFWQTAATLIAVVLFGLAIIVVLGRLVQILLSEATLRRVGVRLFKERVREKIRHDIRLRLEANRVVQSIDANFNTTLEWSYSRWNWGLPKRYLLVEAPREGVISHINLRLLRNLAQRIEDSVQNARGSPERPVSHGTVPVQGMLKNEPCRVVLLKNCGDAVLRPSVTDQNAAIQKSLLLVEVPSDVDSNTFDARFPSIRAMAKAVFQIVPEDPQEIRTMLDGLVDHVSSALAVGETRTAQKILRLYMELAECVLDEFGSQGVVYDLRTAQSESHSLGGGWEVVDWMREDVRDLIEHSIASERRDVAFLASYLPFAISARAMRHGDRYLFTTFTDLNLLTYHLASNLRTLKPNSRFAEEMLQRVTTRIREFSRTPFFVVFGDATKTADDLRGVIDFAKILFRSVNQLVKATLDNEDDAAFRNVAAMLDGLFETVELQRSSPEDAPAGRQAVVEDFLSFVANQKQIITCGVAAYVLSHHLQEPIDPFWKQAYAVASGRLPSDLAALSGVFLKCRDEDCEGLYGWGWWDVPADGKVRRISFDEDVARLFVVRGLALLEATPRRPENEFRIRVDPCWRFLYEEDGTRGALSVVLREAEQPSGRLASLITEGQRAQIPRFRTIITHARAEYAREEEARVIGARLDAATLQQFRQAIMTSVEKQCHLRMLLSQMGAVTKLDAIQANAATYATCVVDRKDAFVTHSGVAYVGWAEAYGGAVVEGEQQAIQEKLFGESQQRTITCQDADVGETINAAVNTLVEHRTPPNVVVTSAWLEGDVRVMGFVPHWKAECTLKHDNPLFAGEFRPTKGNPIPVFQVRGWPQRAGRILVARLSDFACLLQNPAPLTEDENTVNIGRVSIRVVDLNFDDKTRNEVMTEDPDWLRREPDPERYLRKSVLIRIEESFKIEIRDPEAGICINLPLTGSAGLPVGSNDAPAS